MGRSEGCVHPTPRNVNVHSSVCERGIPCLEGALSVGYMCACVCVPRLGGVTVGSVCTCMCTSVCVCVCTPRLGGQCEQCVYMPVHECVCVCTRLWHRAVSVRG